MKNSIALQITKILEKYPNLDKLVCLFNPLDQVTPGEYAFYDSKKRKYRVSFKADPIVKRGGFLFNSENGMRIKLPKDVTSN